MVVIPLNSPLAVLLDGPTVVSRIGPPHDAHGLSTGRIVERLDPVVHVVNRYEQDVRARGLDRIGRQVPMPSISAQIRRVSSRPIAVPPIRLRYQTRDGSFFKRIRYMSKVECYCSAPDFRSDCYSRLYATGRDAAATHCGLCTLNRSDRDYYIVARGLLAVRPRPPAGEVIEDILSLIGVPASASMSKASGRRSA